MKEVLLDTSGRDKIKQVKNPASATKPVGEKKQSFQSVLTARGKDKKSASPDSNDAAKVRPPKGNKKQSVSVKVEASKENKEKSDAEKKQSDKKVVPFVPILSGINLKTIISKITGENPEKTDHKTLMDTTKEEQKKTLFQTGNSDEAVLKKNNKNIQKLFIKDKSNKTNDAETQPAANSKSEKTINAKLAADKGNHYKGKMPLLKTGVKNNSSPEKAITKEFPLFKQTVSTANDHKAKQAVQNMNVNQNQKQISGKLHLAKSANAGTSILEFKKLKSKINGQPAKSTSSKAVQTNSSKSQQAASSQANNVTNNSVNDAISQQQKKLFNNGSLTGKQPSNQSSPENVKLKMDVDTKKDLKGKTQQSSNGSHTSGLKTAHLTEPAGRKAFSQQLARQVSHPQFNQQMSSASKRMTAWKHHRLVLKDGQSIHIASRASNGALQLQLNVGNGQLGKILQQHLQEIQQHVQQQLNIDINLQLQDFSQQQQEQPEQSALKQPKSEPNVEEGVPVAKTNNTAATQQVRYFGFNRNEWTA